MIMLGWRLGVRTRQTQGTLADVEAGGTQLEQIGAHRGVIHLKLVFTLLELCKAEPIRAEHRVLLRADDTLLKCSTVASQRFRSLQLQIREKKFPNEALYSPTATTASLRLL